MSLSNGDRCVAEPCCGLFQNVSVLQSQSPTLHLVGRSYTGDQKQIQEVRTELPKSKPGIFN